MAQYKYSTYLHQGDSAAYDTLHNPGATCPDSGIYRCEACGDEIASNKRTRSLRKTIISILRARARFNGGSLSSHKYSMITSGYLDVSRQAVCLAALYSQRCQAPSAGGRRGKYPDFGEAMGCRRCNLMEDLELLRALEVAEAERRRSRPYSGFFFWPDTALAEREVARTFIESAVSEPGIPMTHLVHRGQGNDPPDCEAVDSAGRRVGIEITELVEGRFNRRDHVGLWAEWNRDGFLERVTALLEAKEEKPFKGGPYDERIVLIHTDEPALRYSHALEWLRQYTPGPFVQIDRAYLLFSYDPERQGYPYLRLA